MMRDSYVLKKIELRRAEFDVQELVMGMPSGPGTAKHCQACLGGSPIPSARPQSPGERMVRGICSQPQRCQTCMGSQHGTAGRSSYLLLSCAGRSLCEDTA